MRKFIIARYEMLQILGFHVSLWFKYFYKDVKCVLTGGHVYKTTEHVIGTEKTCEKCSYSTFTRSF